MVESTNDSQFLQRAIVNNLYFLQYFYFIIMTSSSSSRSFLLLTAVLGLSSFTGAFQIQQRPQTNPNHSSTSLHQTCDGRRNFLSRGAGAAMSVLVAGTALGQPAEASYSAFTNRENDWKEREAKGDIKVSNARQLRAQLREIAPMNGEGIFCPNGASAAVSPLMENKCGERQALPSVYGRTDDAMGNSIPGFAGSGGSGVSASALRTELSAQAYFREN
mmetsp:Transcript_15227/g.32306  ORF Transcript_15227/g.32306 Transcript_15227/m.32306 type:complete len:219 (-) Transcript_15227:132-788(-)